MDSRQYGDVSSGPECGPKFCRKTDSSGSASETLLLTRGTWSRLGLRLAGLGLETHRSSGGNTCRTGRSGGRTTGVSPVRGRDRLRTAATLTKYFLAVSTSYDL
jgi:hypothetical protein